MSRLLNKMKKPDADFYREQMQHDSFDNNNFSARSEPVLRGQGMPPKPDMGGMGFVNRENHFKEPDHNAFEPDPFGSHDAQMPENHRPSYNPSYAERDPAHNLPDDLYNDIPTGNVFKNGASILKPVKAFDKYDMEAVHVDTQNVGGNVREINGRLYAKGENPVIEYTPTEQIIQPNGHITSYQKNHEADQKLDSLRAYEMQQMANQPEKPAIIQMLPNILIGCGLGALIGSYTNNLVTIGSAATAIGSLWLANEANKQEKTVQNDDFRKRFEQLSY